MGSDVFGPRESSIRLFCLSFETGLIALRQSLRIPSDGALLCLPLVSMNLRDEIIPLTGEPFRG